jgi:PAS domain S-box-containing protein
MNNIYKMTGLKKENVIGKRELLYVNDALCEQLGYTRQELLSMRIDDIDKVYVNNRDQMIDRLKKDGNYAFLTRKDGTSVPVKISVSMIEHENEQLIFANLQPT